MSKKTALKPIVAALGTTFAVSLAASPIVNAAENPFALNELSNGYMVADHGEEGKCGEGKCGENKETKGEEGKCGEGMDTEGSSDEEKEKKAEGKCGEAKCGDNK
ncbi:MAG: hypothetical protein HY356_05750 [Gammaproteobacteria bacterium]|nr:hypothetical protein [Gammaproteobacteria bacterium]